MNGPVVLAVPPAPGSADPANLYVDLQSRALWLGVAPEVDPAGAVLISDIVQTQADIVTAEAASKAYTEDLLKGDSGLEINPKGYSGNDHVHTASQITDFEEAVEAVAGGGSSGGFAIGMSMLWAGSLASIGVGPLAGWHLCDGSLMDRTANAALFAVIGTAFNVGTVPSDKFMLPDLRDRFVIGAGNKVPGAVNPNTSFQTPAAEGTHAHTVGNTTLTLAQMPQHRHSVSVSGGTDTQGSHAHTFAIWSNSDDAADHVRQEGTAAAGTKTTSTNGAHDHNVTASGTSEYQGSGAAHNHPLTGAGTHQHTITQANVRDVLPYYALAYIMKIA